jgi:DNA-directed RNA polymerase subunit RPC12/RpoP
MTGGVYYTVGLAYNRTGAIKINPEKCAACPLGPPPWRYRCGACSAVFAMPAPRGPAEEKERACSACGSKNIQRIDIVKNEACPPGG